jgi:hypothetical protein
LQRYLALFLQRYLSSSVLLNRTNDKTLSGGFHRCRSYRLQPVDLDNASYLRQQAIQKAEIPAGKQRGNEQQGDK